MRADRPSAALGSRCLDSGEDRRMLVDETPDRRRLRQAEIAHAVHLRLHFLDHSPRIVAVHAEREAAVKGLVERKEAGRDFLDRRGALRG